jgi:hypothetical protein
VLGHGLREGGVHQLGEWLSKDLILLASQKTLNANPLRQVIPIDWAEIAAAPRIRLCATRRDNTYWRNSRGRRHCAGLRAAHTTA